jgi:hypothetical protein
MSRACPAACYLVGACMRVSGALRRGGRAGQAVHVVGAAHSVSDGQLAQRVHLRAAVNTPRWRKQRSACNLLQHRLQALRVGTVMVDGNCQRRGLLKELFRVD